MKHALALCARRIRAPPSRQDDRKEQAVAKRHAPGWQGDRNVRRLAAGAGSEDHSEHDPLQETGIADAINDSGRYESARKKMFALDFATQAQEMKPIGGQPDYALGSVHAITHDGTLVIASASGSQLASYACCAANVIFVVGTQKLVPGLQAAHERIYAHSLKLEDARAQAAYGQHSSVGKILEIHQELPGRIHIVLIRQPVGF
jgi:acyl-CoA hydrolase